MVGDKRGQGTMVLKVIFAVIIFAILAYATFSAIRKILPSDRAEKSFNELVEKIKKAEEGLQSTPVYLDEGTAIMGFLPSSSSITVKYNKEKEVDYNLIFNKPENCIPGKTCICLCKSFDKSSTGAVTNTYNCISSVCEDIDETIEFSTGLCKEDEKECIKAIESNDFILIRNIEYVGIIAKETTENPRIKALYIEKERDGVGLCEQPPCTRKKELVVATK